MTQGLWRATGAAAAAIALLAGSAACSRDNPAPRRVAWDQPVLTPDAVSVTLTQPVTVGAHGMSTQVSIHNGSHDIPFRTSNLSVALLVGNHAGQHEHGMDSQDVPPQQTVTFDVAWDGLSSSRDFPEVTVTGLDGTVIWADSP